VFASLNSLSINAGMRKTVNEGEIEIEVR